MDISICEPQSDSPSSSSGLPSPSAVSISFILLNTKGLVDTLETNWNTNSAAFAGAPLHLSARREEKIESAELAAAERSSAEFQIMTD